MININYIVINMEIDNVDWLGNQGFNLTKIFPSLCLPVVP